MGIREGDNVTVVIHFDTGNGFGQGGEECGVGGRAGIDKERPTAKRTIFGAGDEGIAIGGKHESVNGRRVGEGRGERAARIGVPE